MMNLNFKLKSLLLLIVAGFAFASCSSDDSSPTNGSPEGDQIVFEYNFAIQGGQLDGQSFSNTLPPEDINKGAFFYESGNVEGDFEKDYIIYSFADENNAGNYVQFTSNILLDGDKNPLPMSSEGEDYTTKSYMGLMVSTNTEDPTEPETVYSIQAKSGTLSFNSLNIYNGNGSPATFDIDFNGTFEVANINNDGLVEVQISGNVKAYQSN